MTPKGMYELKAVKGRELVELVNMFISGLTKRSVYAVAIQDLIRQGASFTVFHFSTLMWEDGIFYLLNWFLN